MVDQIGSDRNRRVTLNMLRTAGVVLAVSVIVVLLVAWGGFLLWLGVQSARALAHLF